MFMADETALYACVQVSRKALDRALMRRASLRRLESLSKPRIDYSLDPHFA